MTNRMRLMLLACFCAAFAAGVAAGAAWTRHTLPPPRGSWIEHALELTPEQRERMREIWSNVTSVSREQRREQRLALQQERDAAIQALLSEEQKAQYEQVVGAYAEKSAVLDEAARKAFEEATEKTKEMLTESQRKKYEELLQRGPMWRTRREPEGMGGPERNSESRESGGK